MQSIKKYSGSQDAVTNMLKKHIKSSSNLSHSLVRCTDRDNSETIWMLQVVQIFENLIQFYDTPRCVPLKGIWDPLPYQQKFDTVY